MPLDLLLPEYSALSKFFLFQFTGEGEAGRAPESMLLPCFFVLKRAVSLSLPLFTPLGISSVLPGPFCTETAPCTSHR